MVIYEVNAKNKFSAESFLETFLKGRNIENIDEFLNPKFENLSSPFDLENINLALEKIYHSITNKKNIMILGHDDADGITSVYVLYKFLENFIDKNNIFPYIPDSIKEGLGLSAIYKSNYLIDNKINLIITVDSSVRNYDEVEYLNSQGIDVIITDHHLLGEKIPNAFAVINPKMGNYPDKMLAGVGVIFQVIRGFLKKYNIEKIDKYTTDEFLKKILLPVVCIGTVCDRVPMSKDNRIITKIGFDNLQNLENVKLQNFLNTIRNEINANNDLKLLNSLAPIFKSSKSINGRNNILDLLIGKSNDYDLLSSITKKLVINNKEIDEIYENLDKIYDFKTYNGDYFIYFDYNLKYSHISSLASRLSSQLKIPTYFIAYENEKFICEARGPEDFNLVDSFNFLKDYLLNYGGHKQAAGFTITDKNNLDLFIQNLPKYFENNKITLTKKKKIEIDFIIDDFSEIINLKNEYYLLQPFTWSFPPPIFGIKNESEEFTYLSMDEILGLNAFPKKISSP